MHSRLVKVEWLKGEKAGEAEIFAMDFDSFADYEAYLTELGAAVTNDMAPFFIIESKVASEAEIKEHYKSKGLIFS